MSTSQLSMTLGPLDSIQHFSNTITVVPVGTFLTTSCVQRDEDTAADQYTSPCMKTLTIGRSLLRSTLHLKKEQQQQQQQQHLGQIDLQTCIACS